MLDPQKVQIERRGAYDADLDWWLNSSEAACGKRSSFAGFVAALERGTVAPSGSPNDLLYDDAQVGFNRSDGQIARERRMLKAWDTLPPLPRRILAIHLTARMPAEVKNEGAHVHAPQAWPRHVFEMFADLSAVALLLAHEAGWFSVARDGGARFAGVLQSLNHQKPVRDSGIDQLEETARLATHWAVDAWLAAKRSTSPRLQRLREKMGGAA